MSSHNDAWPQSGDKVERITWLGDAIFAFSMTLLAIDIRIPEGISILSSALVDLMPRFISFVITFWIVASYWVAFHRLFSYIIKYDRALIRACLLFLMFIILVPFPADMIGRYPTEYVSLITGAILFALTGFTFDLIWVVASRRHRLVKKDLNPKLIQQMTRQYLVSPAVFMLSIPVFILVFTFAPALTQYAAFVWLSILPFQFHFSHA